MTPVAPATSTLTRITRFQPEPSGQPLLASVTSLPNRDSVSYVAIDPGTNSVYVANTGDNTHAPTGTVSVVNGTNCDATNVSGCASQVPPQVPVGADPASTAFDKATNMVYVTNVND